MLSGEESALQHEADHSIANATSGCGTAVWEPSTALKGGLLWHMATKCCDPHLALQPNLLAPQASIYTPCHCSHNQMKGEQTGGGEGRGGEKGRGFLFITLEKKMCVCED